jgi:hypothetical protein
VSEAAVNDLVLNYQRFRGKFHILEVHRNGAGTAACTVAKQIRNGIRYHWGVVAEIDPAIPFRQAEVAESEIRHLFEQAAALHLTADTNHCGKDGTWYSLRIGAPGERAIISWWCGHNPGLQHLYALEKAISKTVLRLLKIASHD